MISAGQQKQYVKPERVGFSIVKILAFLNGHKWDELTYNFLHSVNPSWVRVVHADGEIKTDAKFGRVTVFVDENDRIVEIEQESWVGLTGGHEHGHALDIALAKHD